uniref:Uncharacterized protein n=1 Tax=Oryza sativa subsp. japonica TaxID=39947 RepID=Q5Z8Z6_ORYSJ|nr:hypothetical protein [Oryza sativa Japonica Group]
MEHVAVAVIGSSVAAKHDLGVPNGYRKLEKGSESRGNRVRFCVQLVQQFRFSPLFIPSTIWSLLHPIKQKTNAMFLSAWDYYNPDYWE